MTTIALFGTSADPPTQAHQEIIHWLSQHFDKVAVWTSDNPFKSHQTPLNHRSQMLRLLVEQNMPHRDKICVDPELSKSRTLDTVRVAREKWPDAELYLAIGSDLIEQLPKWYKVEELFQEVTLLAIPRPGVAIAESGLQKLRQMGGKIAIADLQVSDISSTEYRQYQRPQTLTPLVAHYIHRENLYSDRSIT